jgi:non-specific protein-tyrosine kinase
MNNSSEAVAFSVDLRRYLAIFQHWLWLLVGAAILAGGVGHVSARLTPKVYRAETLVMVNEAPASKSTTDYVTLATNTMLAKTYAEVLTTRPLLEAVAQRLGLEPQAVDKGNIKIELIEQTQLIKVSVEDRDPARAAEIANALVAVFAEQNQADQAARYVLSKQTIEAQKVQVDTLVEDVAAQLANLPGDPEHQAQREQLAASLAQYRQASTTLSLTYGQMQLAEAQALSNIVQKEPAVAPEAPIRPNVPQATFLAAVVGLMLAVGLVLLIETLDDTLKDPQELTRLYGLPVLGVIMAHAVPEQQPITLAEPRAPVSEAFRALRTMLQYASVDRPLRSLMITSVAPEDGKTTIAVNLAVSLAQGEQKVILLDADLRRPAVHTRLGLANRDGLSELFVRPQISLNGNLQGAAPNLRVLTSGELPPNPAELLGSAKMAQILEKLQAEADLTLIDCPPVTAATDPVVLAGQVDGVLLVVKPGVTRLPALKQSLEQLQRVGANILGVILNDVALKRSGYRYAYYYQGYHQAYQHYNPSPAPKRRVGLAGLFKRQTRRHGEIASPKIGSQ